MKKKKLTLEDLKVKSFLTEINKSAMANKGGVPVNDTFRSCIQSMCDNYSCNTCDDCASNETGDCCNYSDPGGTCNGGPC
ncbi:pinensin family lanthipeptide [Fulvivirga sp. 29W222]|uniref:Pinensin family lanthipeptide n=1 Tax=Fulvivirga marina TaxID=2494733 RepID=A0A937KDR6_9BACT|nr:pinensin family lanthipeptide [Fulvivirga marina]MBL6446345.1 pinensin family lanthipeptide [Fulvivirga marina]